MINKSPSGFLTSSMLKGNHQKIMFRINAMVSKIAERIAGFTNQRSFGIFTGGLRESPHTKPTRSRLRFGFVRSEIIIVTTKHTDQAKNARQKLPAMTVS